MTFLIAIMSFANFVFYPLVIGTIIAVIIEQIFRATGNEDDPKAVRNVILSMGCLLYTSPSPRDLSTSRMPSSA